MGFVHEFRTLEKFATFGEGRADGMIGSKAFSSAAFVKEVHNSTIQMILRRDPGNFPDR
jgi:hypothetical protein